MFADAAGMTGVLDPTYSVGLGDSLDVPVGIISEDREALFFFIGELPEEAYVFELVDPLGQVITTSSSVGGMSVHIKQLANWMLFRVKFPSIDLSREHVGTWRFRVRIEHPEKWTNEKNAAFGKDGRHRMSFAAAVGSNYVMTPNVGPTVVLVGQEMTIRANLTDGGWPAPNGQVRVTITRPDGSTDTRELFDDATHGDDIAADAVFAARYGNTTLEGTYELAFRSDGATTRGEQIAREATRHHYVGAVADDPPSPGETTGGTTKPCFSCRLMKVLTWLGLLLLVAIFGTIIYCCRRTRLAISGSK